MATLEDMPTKDIRPPKDIATEDAQRRLQHLNRRAEGNTKESLVFAIVEALTKKISTELSGLGEGLDYNSLEMFTQFDGNNEVFSGNRFFAQDGPEKYITIVAAGERINYQPAGMTEKFADIEIRVFVRDRTLDSIEYITDDPDEDDDDRLLLTTSVLTMKKLLGLISDVIDVIEANAHSLELQVPYSKFEVEKKTPVDASDSTVTYWEDSDENPYFIWLKDTKKILTDTQVDKALNRNERLYKEERLTNKEFIELHGAEEFVRFYKELKLEGIEEGEDPNEVEADAERTALTIVDELGLEGEKGKINEAKMPTDGFIVLKDDKSKHDEPNFVRYKPEEDPEEEEPEEEPEEDPEEGPERISWTLEQVKKSFFDNGVDYTPLDIYIQKVSEDEVKEKIKNKEYRPRTCTTQDMLVRQVTTDEGILAPDGHAGETSNN